MRSSFRQFYLMSVLMLTAPLTLAQPTYDISGVGATLIPIAVTNFQGNQQAPQQIAAIIRNDLTKSGRFSEINTGQTPISENDAIDFNHWKQLGANVIATGSISLLNEGRYTINFRLYDTVKKESLGGLSLTSHSADLRMSAHKIADFIYEKLLGIKGVFSTRIAYITRSGKQYQLRIADADGQNARTALTSPEPLISPKWSPNGTQVAYVSFERKKPIVYIHNLATGTRTLASNEKGDNSAPAWTPNGSEIAVALSKEGHTQIYKTNTNRSANNHNLRKLTYGKTIDTEPAFTVDNKFLYFTSDRGGSPQIYRMSPEGEKMGNAQRVTFQGTYNTSPALSPDSKLLAYISRTGGGFKLYLQDLTSNIANPITNTNYDESPSFSANGQYILYATKLNGRNVLATVSIDGATQQILSTEGGNISDPTWGPF